MPANVGSQVVTVKFFDPVDSAVANRIALDLRKVGIYSGGYLTKVSDTLVTLSPLICEIGDGTYQLRAETTTDVTVTVASATPYVVLRWVYTGSAVADYIDFVAVALGDIQTTDVVVGLCSYSGSTLNGFDYTLRTNPLITEKYLKVEPTVPASMYVRVRGGRVSYGTVSYNVVDQLSPLFVAPVSGSRIDLLYVDNDGAVKVITGTAASSPSIPDYQQKAVLAEITITSVSTTITASMIKDVRGFVNAREAVLLTGTQTVAGVKTFSSFPVTPSSSPTTSYQVANKAYVDTKTKKTIGWFLPSSLATGTNVSARIKLDYAVTITKAKAYAKTAPTGANVIFDININGTSIWASNQGNRLKITAGANEDTDTTTFDTTAVAANQYLTLDVDQVGSTVTGSDVTILLEVTA